MYIFKAKPSLTWQQNFYMFIMETHDTTVLENAPSNLNDLCDFIFVPNRVFSQAKQCDILKDFFGGLSRQELAAKYNICYSKLAGRLHTLLFEFSKHPNIIQTLNQGKLVGFSEDMVLGNSVLSAKLKNCLLMKQIYNLKDIQNYTREEISQIRNFDEDLLVELDTYLQEHTKYNYKKG